MQSDDPVLHPGNNCGNALKQPKSLTLDSDFDSVLAALSPLGSFRVTVLKHFFPAFDKLITAFLS